MSLASSRASAKDLIFASAEPGQRDEIELLVDIERFERLLKLLLDRIVHLLLEHIDLAVVGRIGARVRIADSICSSNFLEP